MEARHAAIDAAAHRHERVGERGAARGLLDGEDRRAGDPGGRRLVLDGAADPVRLTGGVQHLDHHVVRARLEPDGRAEAAVGGRADVAEDIRAGEYVHGDASVGDGDAADCELCARGEPVARRVGDLEARERRERCELVIDVAAEEADTGQDDDRQEDHRPKDEAAARDRPVRLERARLQGLRRTPALVVVQHHELVRLEVEVLRVIAQEAARVHRSRERLVIAVLERLQELLAYPRVARGLLERDAFALALCAELLAEPAHPRSGGLCPRRSSS